MRSTRVIAVAAVFVLSVLPSFGACNFPVTTSSAGFAGTRFSWQPVNGATNYEVQVSSDGFQHVTTLRNLGAGTSGVTVNALLTTIRTYSYRIVASNPSSAPNASDVPCTGTANLNLFGIN